jgi:NAD(P)-dependent dehydrogenase (short-subunit alcohol dehydrogenase family)
MAKWTVSDIPDLSGRTAVVTGANSGIGFWTAFWLAAKGARVVMAVRNPERGGRAQLEILAMRPAVQIDVIPLDLASLESVRDFSAVFSERHTALDILVNNAGVMAIPFRRTADGFEMQFGVNHLGHFALTGLLMPRLLAASAARVVTVNSMVHRQGKMDFENLNGEKDYSPWGAYRQSKLANLLFAYELQRRLAAASAPVISVASHPGYARTNLQAVGPALEGSRLKSGFWAVANAVIAQSAAQGALPSLYAATAPDVQGGDFIVPDFFGWRGYPVKAKSSDASYNQADAARLWEISEQATGVQFSLTTDHRPLTTDH